MEIHVNAAVSADGKLSDRRRAQVALSGDDDWRRVDRLRREHDAILVGVGTVLADDPSLTVDGANPTRVVADSAARTPTDAAVLEGDAETLIAVADSADPGDVSSLRGADADVVETQGERVDLAALRDALADRGVERLLVEGGGEILFSCFDAGLVDRLTVYVAPTLLGGRDAPTLVDGEGWLADDAPALALEDVERLDDGVVLDWTVEGGGED